MVSRVKMRFPAGGRPAARSGVLLVALVLLVPLAGCGSTLKGQTPAGIVATADLQPPSAPSGCSPTVLATLTDVVERVYREGVRSERTAVAEYLIAHSPALRAAVESGNRAAASSAARALVAAGHMTNLSITRDARSFVDVGGAALAPVRGTLTSASGAPIATYTTSVWSDEGFLMEAAGIAQGVVVLREGERSIGGSRSLGAKALTGEGALTLEGVAYRYTSFPAEAYPSGAVRIYVLVPSSSIVSLCGKTDQDTTVNTLKREADLIYEGEMGQSAQKQVRRVQRNQALLEAVAHHEPLAAEHAIEALLHQHVVRLRVSAGGRLLSDVGGPYVLAPVSAPLRLGDRTIGSFVLSIQDDEGYLRLTRRLAGLHVLMYMNPDTHPRLVKNSLGPAPGPELATVPADGAFQYAGHSYRVFTVHAEAFPSGPLTIRVLVPIPYT